LRSIAPDGREVASKGQRTVFNRFGCVLLQRAKNLIASSFTLIVVPAFVASFPEIELELAITDRVVC
jgi:hypothetical protein